MTHQHDSLAARPTSTPPVQPPVRPPAQPQPAQPPSLHINGEHRPPAHSQCAVKTTTARWALHLRRSSQPFDTTVVLPAPVIAGSTSLREASRGYMTWHQHCIYYSLNYSRQPNVVLCTSSLSAQEQLSTDWSQTKKKFTALTVTKPGTTKIHR